MKNQCYHCKKILDCEQVGKIFLCKEHIGLKQYQVKQKKTYELKRTPIKTKSRPKQISEKQILSIQSKKLTYERIKNEREHVCTGCGTTENLTHSHLIPISKRKDLENEINNITYHCIHCHSIWENNIGRRRLLLDYSKNMKSIRILDENHYNLLKLKEEKFLK
jgi:5-methylcytosine-specific restriction endonuclease McrA